MYATVAELGAEGVQGVPRERLEALIGEATAAIDRLTGWYFEPREREYRLSGRGTPTLEPPVPPIALERLEVDGRGIPLDSDHVHVSGAPVAPWFYAPSITLRQGVFPRGVANVLATGLWGYTEPDGTPHGRTPHAIERACILLALRYLPKLGDVDEVKQARDAWRIIEERTRDQSYKLDRVTASAALTGDPEIDRLLSRYLRPAAMGAC